MIKHAFLLAGLLTLVSSGKVFSQAFSVPVDTVVTVTEPDSTYQLHQWIQEETIAVAHQDTLVDHEFWELDHSNGYWRLAHPEIWDDPPYQFHFSYEFLPIDLEPRYFIRELVEPDEPVDDEEEEVLVARETLTGAELLGDTQLQRSGSLTRGITVGSAQDFSLESGLRFELSGDITENVSVDAVLTDQNTPIQPEGTTQRIQEFDQVLIQLQAHDQLLELGDVDVTYEDSEFARIDRRLQGAGAMTDFGEYGQYDASAAVVRGEFRSQQFQGEDGIQGPYRLTGNQNERFIIVLAGSERVYVDGQLQQRGEENDYVIDYGLGELEFTSNQIITDASRITVEFQYRTDRYTRTLLGAEAANTTLMDGRLEVGASFLREADNINLSTQLQLSEEERDLLREAGDAPDGITVDGADSVGFRDDADFVLYAKTDTTVNGETFEIFENRPGEESGHYRVQFSRVEEGEGSYRRAGRSVNGVVYEWVGPGQGNYEPHRRLTPPQEQSMFTLRGAYHLTDNISVYGEWAGSEMDRNRFSEVGDAEDFDNAYLLGASIDQINSSIGMFSAGVKQRFIGEDFAFFDRGREVEFERIWNIGDQRDGIAERITEGNAAWQLTDDTGLEFIAGIIDRDDVAGDRQEVTLTSREEGLPFLTYSGERIHSEDNPLDEKGTWYRQTGEVGYDVEVAGGVLSPVLGIEAEDRRQRSIEADTLTHNSFRFYDIKPELRYSAGTITLSAGLSYRQDQRVITEGFEDEATGITQRYSVDWRPTGRFTTENTVSFRSRTFEEIFQIEEQRQDSRGVLMRSVTNYRSDNDLFNARLQYEANTERRPILEETFIEVGPEQGEYVWEDTREDGVKHVDEFFPQQSPNEGTFIRQLVPSDELFPVVNLRVNLRNEADFEEVMSGADTPLERLLEGTRLNSVIEVQEENRTENISDIYLMNFSEFQDDSLTIRGRIYWQQDAEFFRNASDWDLRLRVNETRGINQQANGLEERFRQNFSSEKRYRVTEELLAKGEFSLSTNRNVSENLPSRNYDISGFEILPGVQMRWGRNYQTTTTVGYLQKNDTSGEEVSLEGWRVDNDFRFYLSRRFQGSFNLQWRRNDITGTPTSLGSFELTDGAGAGDTWRWALQADYRISDLLQASLSYDGRTVVDRPLIQTARITVSAVF